MDFQNSKTLLIGAVLALLVIGGGIYLYQNSKVAQQLPATVNPENLAQNATPAPAATQESTSSAVQLTEFTVESNGLNFSPKELKVKKGDKVKITYKNNRGKHNLRVDGYNVGTEQIEAGQTASFEFIADKAGTFEYFCSVPGHREAGMKGSLIVE